MEHGANLYDFEARTYDPATGRFLSIDPMVEKYYSISPYAYCANNPVKFVDSDGRDIKLHNVNVVDKRGNLKSQAGLSPTTAAAVKDLMNTKEGKAFFAQFAKEGDEVGGYTFAQDGALSDVTLNLWDYSADNIVLAQPGDGSIGVSEDKKTVTLKVVSNGADKVEVGETLTHETQLHGFDISNEIKGNPTSTTSKDHKALKNQDTNHKGYKQYKSTREQLQKIDDGYKQAFQDAQKNAQKQY
jgi:RHS repeat-associated protein